MRHAERLLTRPVVLLSLNFSFDLGVDFGVCHATCE